MIRPWARSGKGAKGESLLDQVSPRPAPTDDDYLAPADEPLELVLRHAATGREIGLGVSASLRDLEVLGSAGMHYADNYDNPLRPPRQVERRRQRARRIGAALWDAAVERCDIEKPTI